MGSMIDRTHKELTHPYFLNLTENTKQTQTLTELQDALLPQLISGRVRVGKLEEKEVVG